MGADKATLDWRGTPLVVHVATVLRAAVDGPVVVVRRPGQELPRLPEEVEVTEDAAPDRGPLEGLAAGLRALEGRAEAAFACATDMPLIDVAIVRQLVAELDPQDDAVAPTDGVRLLPLGAVYRTSLRATAERLAAGDDRSLQGLLEQARARVIALSAAELARLRSFDTPDDYGRASRREPPG
jgi:molybdenum cofactor guanylyltransferase